ncbi:MAG: tetratricopeptide repeat protein [Alphaproteobacteria bacterium]|nr:tetratricopeptide repeat protein [Alphaproteobacteria bacterium]
MILFLSAFAADLTEYGTYDGKPVLAGFEANGAVTVSYDGNAHTSPPPSGKCDAHVGPTPGDYTPAFRVWWVCDAKMDAFGKVTERTLTWSGKWAVHETPAVDGLVWVERSVKAAAERDLAEARGLAAQFASRLQFAAELEDREKVLLPVVDAVIRANAKDRSPERAGLRTLDLLQSPPVWELERPWDFGSRLRIGPTAGNRPAPERNAWLSGTPENGQRIRALAETLLKAGHHAAAEELAQNLVDVFPKDGAAQLLLGDVRWARGDLQGAREAYAKARELGQRAERVDRRLQPG